MKATLHVLIAVLLVALVPTVVVAQDDDGASGYIAFGINDVSTSGSPDLAAEYLPGETSGTIKIGVSAKGETGSMDLRVDSLDRDDYDVTLKFDAMQRVVRSKTALTGLIHRLGHESLEHFATATAHGRLTQRTDHNPSDIYEIDYSLFDHRTEFQPRSAQNVTFGVGYRQQVREGLVQATTISHCGSCHVQSQSRRINEEQQDAIFDATVAWDGGSVDFSATRRKLDTDPMATTFLFDDALHPEQLKPLFDNRLSFDSAEGPQPFDVRPDISKAIYRLGTTFNDVGGFVLSADGVASTTQNDYSGRDSDYSGFLVTAARNFGNNTSLRWRGRQYSINVDDYYVDVRERPGIAGPQLALYRDIYGVSPDFISQSAANRDVTESKFDFTKRFGKKTGNLRFFWKYEDIDRDTYEVAAGETGTTKNVYGLSWSARPKKGFKTNVLVQHGEVDAPFMNVDGQYSTLVSFGPNASPFLPTAAQYYEFHAARIADVSASPASWDEVKLRGTYVMGNTMLSGSYRYWDGENNDGDLTDWAKSKNALNLSIWQAPSETFEWHVAYTMSESEIDAPAAIPLFDG